MTYVLPWQRPRDALVPVRPTPDVTRLVDSQALQGLRRLGLTSDRDSHTKGWGVGGSDMPTCMRRLRETSTTASRFKRQSGNMLVKRLRGWRGVPLRPGDNLQDFVKEAHLLVENPVTVSRWIKVIGRGAAVWNSCIANEIEYDLCVPRECLCFFQSDVMTSKLPFYWVSDRGQLMLHLFQGFKTVQQLLASFLASPFDNIPELGVSEQKIGSKGRVAKDVLANLMEDIHLSGGGKTASDIKRPDTSAPSRNFCRFAEHA
ncbi:hypothetical protein B0F90DRAFT_1669636 [Multifurca ochricompacta]|uniref:Uncharacterized protein n=1 Tax=Multifurca ochricompacta TaxID=376703 RepID=A0AAD4M0F4_9AGAM|nr:hypothetical protein B0F90DRAFT_1669636 [Multifurca ochricompacta]